jgi:hypothetical protein
MCLRHSLHLCFTPAARALDTPPFRNIGKKTSPPFFKGGNKEGVENKRKQITNIERCAPFIYQLTFLKKGIELCE